jgi:holo-ACP synthase
MTHALRALDVMMTGRSWTMLNREVRLKITGPEALLVVDADSRKLKEATTRLEDEHPLGRLWDLDVLDPAEGAISRRTLSQAPRRCLLCGESAHHCTRSRAHPLSSLQEAIQKIIHAYRVP